MIPELPSLFFNHQDIINALLPGSSSCVWMNAVIYHWKQQDALEGEVSSCLHSLGVGEDGRTGSEVIHGRDRDILLFT